MTVRLSQAQKVDVKVEVIWSQYEVDELPKPTEARNKQRGGHLLHLARISTLFESGSASL